MKSKVLEKGFNKLYAILIGSLILMQAAPGHADDVRPLDKNIFSQTFQATIIINNEIKNSSVLQHEYNDPDNKRNTIIQYADKKTSRIIQDQTNKQVLSIADDTHKCSVSDLPSGIPSSWTYPFGEENTNSKELVFRSTTITSYLKNNKLVPMTPVERTIRGIKVNSWSSQFSWGKKNFKMIFYFAVKDWRNSGGVSASPIRFTLTDTTSKTPTINYTYDYLSFFHSIEVNPESVFESPSGVVCAGKKSNVTLPDLPPAFTTGIEITVGNSIKIFDIIYSKGDNLLKIDYQPGGIEDKPHPETVNTVSEIFDYNAGVHYLKDLKFGNCSSSSINKTSHGASFEGSIIRQVMDIFGHKKDLKFVGQRSVRYIECYVFTSHQEGFMAEDGSVGAATFEIYLSSNDWDVIPDQGFEAQKMSPVRVNIFTDKGDWSYELNFINFLMEERHVDISSCYGTMSKMHISVLLSGTYMKSSKSLIEATGKTLLQNIMKLNPLQIQGVQLYYDSYIMYLYATILDRKPAEAQFSLKTVNNTRMSGDKTYEKVTDSEDCAEKCINYKGCTGFQFCGSECDLSVDGFKHQIDSDSSSLCYYYSRTMEGTKVNDNSLRLAYNTLVNAVNQGQFEFTVDAGNVESEYIGLYVRLDTGKLYESNLPKFEDDFQYQSEILIPNKHYYEEIKVYYDKDKGLARIDVNTDHCSGLCNGPTEIVQDFNKGIAYMIDKNSGRCQLQPLYKAFDVTDKNKMANGSQIFYFDNTFKYVGQQHVRGLMTDVFEGYSAAFNGDLFRYYFLNEDWSSNAFVVPVKLEITSDRSDSDLSYRHDNYFGFITDILMSSFDITSCYRENNKITDIQITFKGSYRQRPENFIMSALNKINELVHVDHVNLQNPEISYDDANTYLRVSLIDPAPQPISLFKVNPQQMAQSSGQTKLGVLSPNECAAKCVNNNCKTFAYCEGKNLCQMYSEVPTVYKDDKSCHLYVKSDKKAATDALTTKQVLRNLASLVDAGTFKISFTLDKELDFTATALLDNIDRSNKKSMTSITNMKKFTKLDTGGVLKSPGPIYDDVSVEDCATLCTSSKVLNCEAFSYCYLSGTCFLSSDHPNVTNTNPVDACNIFQRNYVNMFDRIPGKTFPMKGKLLPVKAQSPDVCAKSCINDGIKSCQSFEFCPDKLTCTLSSKHVLDVPSKDIITTASCDLYSVSALQHFVQSKAKPVKLVSDILVKNISVKACAKMCMEDEGHGCVSFNYCPSESICQITGLNKIETKVESNIKANCSNYIRVDPPPPEHFKSVQKSGNKGKLVGLGFGMLLLGCLVGLISIYLIHKKPCIKRDDPMAQNLYKMDEQ